MLHSQKLRAWVIGLALFSMFFGSGNLIFPLSVGQFAQGHYLAGTLGFLLTAALVPFMGVIAMVMFQGNYERFFALFGKTLGFLLTFALLTFWIPLGSGPRCVTLSFAAIQRYLGGIPLWGFSLIYTGLIFVLTYKKNRVIDILGKILTPLLLISLGVVFIKGVWDFHTFVPVPYSSGEVFTYGLKEGYNTQDLIAAFFFSSSVIGILAQTITHSENKVKKGVLKLAFTSSVIGIVILGVVYLGLLFLGAAHAPILVGVSKDALLPTLVHTLLGAELGFIAAGAVALACVTTSVALALVFSDFLRISVCKNKINHPTALGITSLITFGVSLVGFAGISTILSAAMSIFYPLLIVMILINCGWMLYKNRHALDVVLK